MPDKATRGRGRPYIGPRVDFRIPEEVKEGIEAEAKALGIAVDKHYRDVLLQGWAVGAGART